MGKPGIVSFKLLLIVVLFVGFSFILIAQRLESKTYDTSISQLEKEIRHLNIEKQELSVRINTELERLSENELSKTAKPIAMRDVVVVQLPEIQQTPDRKENSEFTNSIDRLIAFLFLKPASMR